jgi:hypothetical protein
MFFKINDSTTVTKRVFLLYFDIGRSGKVLTHQTILNWVTQFRTTASIVNKKPPGCPRTVRTLENVRRVANAFQSSPQHSAHCHSVAYHLSPRAIRHILYEDLKFHPFKIQVVQKHLPRDLKKRSEYYRKLLQMIKRAPQLLDHLMSDEAHFHLNGTVNKQNFRYWSAENPHVASETTAK